MHNPIGATVKSERKLSVAMVWSQFAAYHVDRCEAVARRLSDRAEILAVEVATTSVDYAWEPSGDVVGARKVTLFPGQSFDSIPPLRRFRAMFAAVKHCDMVAIGISYGERDAILLSWALRMLGKKVVVFSESKFDDTRRSVWFELTKSMILGCYSAAIVGGRRHIDYFRFLRFQQRPVLPGYDGVGMDRVRRQAGGILAPAGVPFCSRPFVYVGRFVNKKNLVRLAEGYARYVELAGDAPRRLILVGSGSEEDRLRRRIADLGIGHLIDFPGFLSAEAVSRTLAGSLALMLVSAEEQWGLVVNEALALGLPAVISHEVGSGDALVRNFVNGFVVESNCPEAIGRAMLHLSADEGTWENMVAASHARAWMGDTDRLADAVELLLYPGAEAASDRVKLFLAEMELEA